MPALKLFQGGQFTLSTHFIKLITLLYIHQCGTTVSQPLTPYDQYSCSPYCSLYISLGADMENLFSNQKLLLLLIITFILVTFILDSGVIFFFQEKLDAYHSQGSKVNSSMDFLYTCFPFLFSQRFEFMNFKLC